MTRLIGLTTLAMLAFAGNSLLCRAALRDTAIDAASFTSIRLVPARSTSRLIVAPAARPRRGGRQLAAAFCLFAYAAGFSFAYRQLTAATGALLLFGAVQTTMLVYGLWRGERCGRCSCGPARAPSAASSACCCPASPRRRSRRRAS